MVTGLRDGEKICEELITDDEGISETIHNKIMVLSPSSNVNGYHDQESFKEDLAEKVARLYDAAHRCDTEAVKTILKEIVPEYTPCDYSGASTPFQVN